MTLRRSILLPVETLNRELDCRLFLGCMAAAPENRVFIGQHEAVFDVSQQVRGGLYVGKHFMRQLPAFNDPSRYQALKARGLTVLHLDEEGAVYDGDEDRWRWWLLEMQFDPRTLGPEDYVCTWGDFQRDFYRSLKPACAEQIVTTGHPRFDLYKPAFRRYFEAQTAPLRQRYGDFILVNTNPGYANNGLGLADTFSARVGYDAADAKARLVFTAQYAHDLTILANFVRLVQRMSAEFPGTQIILRPHPTESLAYYQHIFRSVPNVHVVRDGPVAPWLFACRALVHDGCTTGLEAYLAGVSVVNYKSIVDPRYDLFLTNLFGVKCFTDDAVVAALRTLLPQERNGPPPADFSARAYSLLANFQQDSFARLLGVMRDAEAMHQAQIAPEADLRAIRRHAQAQAALRAAKDAVRPLFPARHRRYQAMRTFFRGLDEEDLRRKIECINGILGTRITLYYLSETLICLEAEG